MFMSDFCHFCYFHDKNQTNLTFWWQKDKQNWGICLSEFQFYKWYLGAALLRMESRYFLNKMQKRGQQNFIDTADKVMIPVAFCFWATEEDLRLEHIPWLTWWDVIGSSSRACSQYYGVFRLPSSPQFLEVTAVCPAPWHFLSKKKKERETF